MSYSIKRAGLIADQLERLATQNVHQLAGQSANLAFWISEAVTAIAAIDQYPTRFRLLRDAQLEWVEAHGTKVSGYCAQCGGACELGPSTPAPPQRIPSEDLDAARELIRRGARRYLLRLYHAHFMDEQALRRACAEVGVGLEVEDFARNSAPLPEDDALPVETARSRRRGGRR